MKVVASKSCNPQFHGKKLISISLIYSFVAIFFYKNYKLDNKFGPAEIYFYSNDSNSNREYYWHNGNNISEWNINTKWTLFYKKLCRQEKFKIFL